jgi:hypothetical protein
MTTTTLGFYTSVQLLFVCLFVCLFHGVPEVRGGRRLTKDGPYATRRQAEAFLFVRRKPTPPFAGCQGNLLFRGSRGLQTGRPVDHRPYSARHVGLLVGSFWNNKCTTNPVPPRPPPLVGMARYASTPRRHTVEVCASLGPQQASRLLFNALSSVHPVDVHVLSVQSVVCA